MRILMFTLFALLTTPALAQGWDRYDNGRFGYGIDIPPGFVGTGESGNGDGQSFYNKSGAQGLLVWGGNLTGDFATEVAAAMDYAQVENGWSISYQAVTQHWANFSGVEGSRMLYQRMIALCDGTSYAAFRAEYSAQNAAVMGALIEKLALSLRGSCS